MSDILTPDIGGEKLLDEPLSRALGERYLQYALSTITNRALPDARDGLKPVHRRLLYAMRQLKLEPGSSFSKSALIVGEVMGKFHPHGDQAIYDALVRLAQDFSVRYPLVDGQGNFGNIDGDNPAAMRYTESRMTEIARQMLEGLDEDAVDLKDAYDGKREEPAVLPAAFPNLLANGASGIAVGMATSIPPHNAGELCDALLTLIKRPGVDESALLEHVPGPDFPTGGVLVEPRENIAEAYRTGRGAFRLRARWSREDLGRGMYHIVVTEIPYQVQKSKLIERLAELVTSKKVPILADIRDESAEDVRIIIEPKSKAVDPAVLMETLFKLSDLETRFSLNLNVLTDGKTPEVVSLKRALRIYLDHRRDVLLRRSRHRLDKIARRLEILEGYLKAYLNLDRVIEIIRTEDEPKPALVMEFALTDTQAEAILNMRLRSLRRLEEMEIRKEREKLLDEQAELTALTLDDKEQWRRIGDEVKETRKKFGANAPGGDRRTNFGEIVELEDAAMEAMIEREPITVVCSAKGWIRAMKGHLAPNADVKYKDGDEGRFLIQAQTTDKLLLFATNGRFYTIGCDKLPSGRGMGEPLRLSIDLAENDDIIDLFVPEKGAKRLVASSDGRGFIAPEDDVMAQTRAGKQVLTTADGAQAKATARVAGDMVAIVGQNRKMLIFAAAELPEMTRGKGVILQRYKSGGLSDVASFDSAAGLSWLDPAGRRRTESDVVGWTAARATQGVDAPRGFPKDNRFD